MRRAGLVSLLLFAGGCLEFHDVPGSGSSGDFVVEVEGIEPLVARDRTVVRLLVAADRAVDRCRAAIGLLEADCSDRPDGTRCRCSLAIAPAMPEGTARVDVAAYDGALEGRSNASVEIDRTAPTVRTDGITVTRGGLGVADRVAVSRGALDDPGTYAGRAVVSVKFWVGARTTPVLVAVPDEEGAVAEVALPDTAEASGVLALSAVDLAGNESGRAVFDSCPDAPVADASRIVVVRKPLGIEDGLRCEAGAFKRGNGAIVAALLRAVLNGQGGQTTEDLGEVAVRADGGVDEIAIGGTATGTMRTLELMPRDKCGLTTDTWVRAGVGGDFEPPAVDCAKITYVNNASGNDEVRGAAGAIRDVPAGNPALPSGAVFPLEANDDPGMYSLGSFAVAADGSFVRPVQDVGKRLSVFAWDKAGNSTAFLCKTTLRPSP